MFANIQKQMHKLKKHPTLYFKVPLILSVSNDFPNKKTKVDVKSTVFESQDTSSWTWGR